MRRVWVWLIVGVVAIVAIGGGIYWLTRPDGSGGTTPEEVRTGDQAQPGATKTACDVFTPDIAQQVLGSGARKADLPPGAGQVSTDDVSVSQCMYEVEQGDTLVIANILVRGAKNSEAYATNEFGFNSTRNYSGDGAAEVTSESIPNLGDDAYYNPAFRQVNVLVNSGQYWLIVQNDAGRAQAEQLAQEVVKSL